MRWDVVVVGAGAAGLLAAARAAEAGRHTLLLEKNARPGVKILMSGGTRCNLTQNTDRRGIIDAFGKPGRFLHSALAALGPRELVALVEAEGVPTKVEETGKIFPVSNRATDVLEGLMRRFRRSGATLALNDPLLRLRLDAQEFELTTASDVLRAGCVIITTGGKSYPGCGTTGDGYHWAAGLGHTVVPLFPALTPITSSEPWIRSLRGITLPDVELRVVEVPPGSSPAVGRPVVERRRGSLLFAHFGLSGPAPLDASRVVSRAADLRSLRVECDFVPEQSEATFTAELQRECAVAGKRELVNILANWLPHRLAETLAQRAGLPSERRGAELNKTERQALVRAVKGLEVAVSGTLGFEKAEVTAGGVSLDEVDSRTMESKLVPSLYFGGEVLDLDGPIGGYNFQAAFSTGWLAGESAARKSTVVV